MHHPAGRIAHTMAFVTPVVEHWLEREIAQWVHPMKDRSDDPSHHERTLLPRSYISLPSMVRESAHGAYIYFMFKHSALGPLFRGARCGSVVRASAHGAVGYRIDPLQRSKMWLRGKSIHSWCDGLSDRSSSEEQDVAPW